MNSPILILASASPRRRQFFHAFGLHFAIETADLDETPVPGETPVALVERLAVAKALTVGRRLADGNPSGHRPPTTGRRPPQRPAPADLIIVGADTSVAIDDEILGKPASAAEASEMLMRLRARLHQVHTALVVAYFVGGRCLRRRSLVNTTTVEMRRYSDAAIAAYVATGAPLDKAGAYGIQHQKFKPVAKLVGCPAGVMGLPAADLLRLLTEFGLVVTHRPIQVCGALTGFPCCQNPSG